MALTFDLVMGLGLTVAAAGIVIGLTLWSRSIIERIHSRSPGSLKEIQKEILNGRSKP
jgi:hypothetical protein